MNKNNFSVGVDIESIERFVGLDREKSTTFLSKIFTKNELDYCFSKQYPAQYLSVRFAAKEAVIKAINSLKEEKPLMNKIEVKKSNQGIPSVDFNGFNIKMSLSHCADFAVALVIVEKI